MGERKNFICYEIILRRIKLRKTVSEIVTSFSVYCGKNPCLKTCAFEISIEKDGGSIAGQQNFQKIGFSSNFLSTIVEYNTRPWKLVDLHSLVSLKAFWKK